MAGIAETETLQRPDDVFAWFNLGTALTRMGGLTGENQYYQGGAQAFDRAREIGLPPRMLWYQFQPYLAYLKLDRYQDVVTLADATLETQGGVATLRRRSGIRATPWPIWATSPGPSPPMRRR